MVLYMLVAVVVSLLTGLTVVLSRTFNAYLADHTSIMKSTLYNYVLGLLTSLIILAAIGGLGSLALPAAVQPSLFWIYTGGILGVITVAISNKVTLKISAFYMTLLLFVGQVFAGILLDAALSQTFEWKNLLGGILVAAGLIINMFADK